MDRRCGIVLCSVRGGTAAPRFVFLPCRCRGSFVLTSTRPTMAALGQGEAAMEVARKDSIYDPQNWENRLRNRDSAAPR